MVKEQTACKNRNNEASSNPVIRRLAKRKLREIEKHIKDIEKEIRKVLRKDEKVKKASDLLVSIPGVSFVTACMDVLGELGDLRRFERARQLSAFAGLSQATSVRNKCRRKTASLQIRKSSYTQSIVYGCHVRRAVLPVYGETLYADVISRQEQDGGPGCCNAENFRC